MTGFRKPKYTKLSQTLSNSQISPKVYLNRIYLNILIPEFT